MTIFETQTEYNSYKEFMEQLPLTSKGRQHFFSELENGEIRIGRQHMTEFKGTKLTSKDQFLVRVKKCYRPEVGNLVRVEEILGNGKGDYKGTLDQFQNDESNDYGEYEIWTVKPLNNSELKKGRYNTPYNQLGQ